MDEPAVTPGEVEEEPLVPDPRVMLRVGDVTQAWCRVSGVREDKIFTGYSLVCLHCYPGFKLRPDLNQK